MSWEEKKGAKALIFCFCFFYPLLQSKHFSYIFFFMSRTSERKHCYYCLEIIYFTLQLHQRLCVPPAGRYGGEIIKSHGTFGRLDILALTATVGYLFRSQNPSGVSQTWTIPPGVDVLRNENVNLSVRVASQKLECEKIRRHLSKNS